MTKLSLQLTLAGIQTRSTSFRPELKTIADCMISTIPKTSLKCQCCNKAQSVSLAADLCFSMLISITRKINKNSSNFKQIKSLVPRCTKTYQLVAYIHTVNNRKNTEESSTNLTENNFSYYATSLVRCNHQRQTFHCRGSLCN